MASPDRPDRRVLSPLVAGLAGGAALVGGWLLLGQGRARAVAGVADPGGAEDTSGRGSPSTPPSRRARREGHETSDASARAAAWVLAVFAVTALASVGLVIVGLSWLRRMDAAAVPPLTAEQRATVVPPLPRLQVDHPVADLDAVRAHEEGLLHGWGWVDQARTQAHIPIERAMSLVVGRSLDPQR